MASTATRTEPVRSRQFITTVSKIAIVIVAAAIALFPPPADWVEGVYSDGFYPALQSLSTRLSNLSPFALADVLVLALALGLPFWWCLRIVRAGEGRRRRAVSAMLLNTVVLAGAIFIGFEVLWGFNYVRKPLAVKLDYDVQRINNDAVRNLKRLTAEQLNAEVVEAHSNPWPDEAEWRSRLLESFNETLIELGNRRGLTPAIPKKSLLRFYLQPAGIDGFTNPFGHEVILDPELLPIEKPFVLSHEWAHLAGFPDEAEASFVGLLACLRSDLVALRYSGWLALYEHTPWHAAKPQGQSAETTQSEPPAARPAGVSRSERNRRAGQEAQESADEQHAG